MTDFAYVGPDVVGRLIDVEVAIQSGPARLAMRHRLIAMANTQRGAIDG
jgi:hypothetical protein